MAGLAGLVDLFFRLYTFLVIGRVLLSYARISPYHPVAEWIHRLTEPLLAPIRNMIPQTGMFDWSPMIAMFVLIVLRQIVLMLLFGL